jgi:AraC-like DNA-binding protein
VGLGERTFRRRLAAEGTSLRALSDDVRRAYAERAIAEGISLEELAPQVGFSDASALSRAHKRWTRSGR